MGSYVICRTEYQYNDENYEQGESLGGLPICICASEAAAENEMKSLLIEFYRNVGDLCYYSVEFYEDDRKRFNELTGQATPEDDWVLNIPKNLSDEAYLALAELCKLEPYSIHEVHVED